MQTVLGHEGKILVEEIGRPEPGVGEALVKVAASGINAADWMQARGKYPPPPGFAPDRLGLEFSGTVAGCGEGVRRLAMGEPVMGITGGEAQSEYITVPESALVPVPEGVDLIAAGGFPEAAFTAVDALFNQANLALGDRVLVTGALGGVGSAAIQIAALAGAQTTAWIRSHDRDAEALGLGAQETLVTAEIAQAGPWDIVIELVTPRNIPSYLGRLAIGARVVVIGFAGGASVEVDVRALATKRASIAASTLRTRPWSEKSLLAQKVERHLLDALASRAYRIPVEATYPVAEAAAAYDHFLRPGKLGKVVIAF